jgi:hypothetical protein
MPSNVFMCSGTRLSECSDSDAIWVTVLLLDISPADNDEYIMQYVLDRIQAQIVIIGNSSLSRARPKCISIALPLDRVSRHYPGLLEHAANVATWWLEQIHEGTIQLDRGHIFS